MKEKDTIKLVELFAGVGGFRLGFENVSDRFETVWFNQFEPSSKNQFAYKCYTSHWPNIAYPNTNADITTIDKTEIPDHDILCGGFPCLAKGTLVYTDRGYVEIENITTKDKVLDKNGDWQNVLNVVNQGIKETYTIKLTNQIIEDDFEVHTEIRATENHKFLAIKRGYCDWEEEDYSKAQWVSVEDLAKDPQEYEILHLNIDINNRKLLTWNTKPDLPKQWTTWYIAGKSLSTGELDYETNQIILDLKNKECLNWFILKIGPHERYQILDNYKIAIWNKELFKLVSYLDKQGYASVLQQPINVIETFMRGYEDTWQENKPLTDKELTTLNNLYSFGWAAPIESITKNEEPEEVWDIEVENTHSFTANGFITHNCQSFSIATRRDCAKGMDCDKGELWWQIYETLKVKQPKIGLFENVDRLLKSPSKQKGRDFAIILNSLNELGYVVEWRVINAAEYGAGQKRKRTYIIAYKNELLNNEIWQETTDPYEVLSKTGIMAQAFPIEAVEHFEQHILSNSREYIYDTWNKPFLEAGVMSKGMITTAKVLPKTESHIPLKDMLETYVSSEYYLTDKQKNTFEYKKSAKKLPRIAKDGTKYFYTEGKTAYPDILDRPARTILTSEGMTNRMSHVVEDPETKNYRFITPLECERIQGFPDNWTNVAGLTKRNRYFVMGNALVVGMISRIVKVLENYV